MLLTTFNSFQEIKMCKGIRWRLAGNCWCWACA